jgi:Tetracyclin repressor-like, C-terminal domain
MRIPAPAVVARSPLFSPSRGLSRRRSRVRAPSLPFFEVPANELTADARDVVNAHVDTLVAQLARIVADGVARGEFEATDPDATGRAIFDATARFHNPVHAPQWSNPGIDAAYERVRALVLNGLTPKRSRRAR